MDRDRAVLIVFVLGSAVVVILTALAVLDVDLIPRVPQKVLPVAGAPR